MPSNEGQVPGPENRGLSTRPGSSTDTLALIDYRQLWVLGIHVSVLPSNLWPDKNSLSNHDNFICLYDNVPRIITDILKNGAQLAIISCNRSKALCDRALWYFKAIDPKTCEKKSIIHMVKYDEVVNGNYKESTYSSSPDFGFQEERTAHFERIQGWSGALNYEGNARGSEVLILAKIHPDILVNLLMQGKSRVDLKESARWGYATYITDNPTICFLVLISRARAKYFSDWIKADTFSADTNTCICEMWIRDKDIFDSLGKIWVPELRFIMMNNKNWIHQHTAWSQEDRDQLVLRWGVDQLEERIQCNFVTYKSQIKAWNITVPPDTWANFQNAKEDWIKP
ncbi:uncharacterized protein EDB93DRAFT_1105921 [Suillus bovinus]|uniref:uncharacterized protein n=1 Tax=Suillus bovinus TaxID=48563 RepID=UPI001B8711DC|nr:uncharacterized protein EDB93DRAFT_1105921 [Suillus bovinus]KAG2140523.1 hypothetical protein EDB93DRAFT_1105921 [Suillus bovinus]